MRTLARLAVSLVAATGLGAVGTMAPAAAVRNPIDHVVVLMQENRSFDSYFGRLHFEGQPHAAAEPLNARNPNPVDPTARPIRAAPFYCKPPPDPAKQPF